MLHYNAHDLINQKFNKLLVISYAGSRKHGNGSSVLWNCLCDCGKKTKVTTYELTHDKIKSCGCWRSEEPRKRYTNHLKSETSKNSNARAVYNQYRTNAKNRGILFKLSIEDAVYLYTQNCSYCDRTPQNKMKSIRANPNDDCFYYNGIDRIDSNGDYTLENCVTACEQCNKAKLDYSIEEFKSWIEKAYNNIFVKPNLGY